jgi:hypothetical protein
MMVYVDHQFENHLAISTESFGDQFGLKEVSKIGIDGGRCSIEICCCVC